MEWVRGPTIGRGSSAVVSIATTTSSGDHFAVKSADLSSSASLQREAELISQLRSPYVVLSFGSDITRENNALLFNLFLEYIPGGTLSDQIKKQGGSLGEAAIRSHARRILLGLDYLHRQGVAHCDVKGQNILAGEGGLKIADFGCAKRVDSGDPAAFSGTPAYMAPEVARGEEQGFPADVWALGCTIIEMATGSGPWPEMRDPATALYRIGFSGDVPDTPSWLSGAAQDMLAKCLMRNPKERWTVSRLLQHPFFDHCVEEEIGSCGEIKELTRKSPTSVMDKGFWDALDCSEVASSSDSPTARVRGLVGENSPEIFNPDFSGWADEEDWLRVRSSGDEICPKVISIEELINVETLTLIFGVTVEDEEESTHDDILVSYTVDLELNSLDGDCSSASSLLSTIHSNDLFVKSENYVDGIKIKYHFYSFLLVFIFSVWIRIGLWSTVWGLCQCLKSRVIRS